jgi:hypothetical protein
MSPPDPRPADVNFPDNGINVPDLVTNLSDPIQPIIIPTPVISNDSATTPPLNANQRKKRNLKAKKATAKALTQDLDEMVRSCKWQDAQNELAGPPIPSGRKPKPIKPTKVKPTIDWDPKLLFPNLKVKPPKQPKAKKPKSPPIDYILLKSKCDNVAQLNKFTQQLESLRPVADPIDDDDNNSINDIDVSTPVSNDTIPSATPSSSTSTTASSSPTPEATNSPKHKYNFRRCNRHPKVDHSPRKIRHRNAYFANKNSKTLSNIAYMANHTTYVAIREKVHYLNHLFQEKHLYVPRNVTDIDNQPDEFKQQWLDAIIAEINSIKDNETFLDTHFDFSDIPKGKIVPSQLVFDIRKEPNGTIKKFKCRLVARGDQQGFDTYNNTFADTVSSKSVNMLFSLACKEDMEMESIDIKTAFLYSKINEDIYLKRPAGLTDAHMPAYVKLNKCIYGLKQAAHEWRETLHKELIKLGFHMLPSDNCVYKRDTSQGKIILAIHVDDVLVAATTKSMIDDFNQEISKTFEISTNNPLTSYLGMSIDRNRESKTIKLSQPGYISEMLAKYLPSNSTNTITPSTPMSASPYAKLKHTDTTLLKPPKVHEYMSKVGSLMYLAIHTRPDIAYAIGCCARKMQNPCVYDMTAVDRILRYIEGTKDLGLTFHGLDGSIKLSATVDASFASDEVDRKSHYGITLHLNPRDAAFHSQSKKAPCVALSSTEAEYLALCEAAKLIAWGRQFLSELGYVQTSPTDIQEDNKSTIHMVYNGNDKGRTKHIDVRYHYIREMIADGKISVSYLNTLDMISDMLTKPLETKLFVKHRDNLLGNHHIFVKEITTTGTFKQLSNKTLANLSFTTPYTNL